jgi:hypothetical protein
MSLRNAIARALVLAATLGLVTALNGVAQARSTSSGRLVSSRAAQNSKIDRTAVTRRSQVGGDHADDLQRRVDHANKLEQLTGANGDLPGREIPGVGRGGFGRNGKASGSGNPFGSRKPSDYTGLGKGSMGLPSNHRDAQSQWRSQLDKLLGDKAKGPPGTDRLDGDLPGSGAGGMDRVSLNRGSPDDLQRKTKASQDGGSPFGAAGRGDSRLMESSCSGCGYFDEIQLGGSSSSGSSGSGSGGGAGGGAGSGGGTGSSSGSGNGSSGGNDSGSGSSAGSGNGGGSSSGSGQEASKADPELTAIPSGKKGKKASKAKKKASKAKGKKSKRAKKARKAKKKKSASNNDKLCADGVMNCGQTTDPNSKAWAEAVQKASKEAEKDRQSLSNPGPDGSGTSSNRTFRQVDAKRAMQDRLNRHIIPNDDSSSAGGSTASGTPDPDPPNGTLVDPPKDAGASGRPGAGTPGSFPTQ